MDENRKFQIFEDYTKSVCRKIMSPRKRNEVREELYSHLLEEYERNSALGMDDEAAQTKAIEKMGDEEKIANDFGALYSVVPTEYMRSSLNFIILGLVFITFKPMLLSSFSGLTQFIGQMLMLFGLFKLRKNEKNLNIATYYYVSLVFVGKIYDFIKMYFVLNEVTEIVLLAIFLLANLVYYYLLTEGLNKLCQRIITQNDKVPHLYFGYAMLVLFYIIAGFATVAEIQNVPIISILPFIIFLLQLRRAKLVLAREEPEFELCHSIEKKDKRIYLCLVAVLTVIPFISMYISISKTPQYELFNPTDINIEQSSVDIAREKMLELNFPAEYLADLPDSEVFEYSNATFMSKYDYDANLDEDSELVEVFCFFYPDGQMRVLYRVELSDECSSKYRKGFSMELSNYQFIQSNNASSENILITDGFGRFFCALSQVKGKTVSSEYLADYSQYGLAGNESIAYEYSYPKNSTERRAYFATTAYIQDNSTDSVLFVNAHHYSYEAPFYSNYTIENTLKTNLIGTYYSTEPTLYSRQYCFNVDYLPEYKSQDEVINLDETNL